MNYEALKAERKAILDDLDSFHREKAELEEKRDSILLQIQIHESTDDKDWLHRSKIALSHTHKAINVLFNKIQQSREQLKGVDSAIRKGAQAKKQYEQAFVKFAKKTLDKDVYLSIKAQALESIQ